ncbi:hypothetical protein ACTXT7_012977 [Hymenolepis weldensis]
MNIREIFKARYLRAHLKHFGISDKEVANPDMRPWCSRRVSTSQNQNSNSMYSHSRRNRRSSGAVIDKVTQCLISGQGWLKRYKNFALDTR